MAQEHASRQPPDELADVKRLTEQAKKKRPDKNKFARARNYAEAAERSSRFEEKYGKSSIDGRPIHHFHKRGEYVIGIIAEAQGETYGPSSFPFALDHLNSEIIDPPRAIRLPGNRRLAVAIRKADCLYQRIRVTYLGKLHAKTGGHYEKVYLVEPAPLSKEPMTPAGKKEHLHSPAADASTVGGGK